MKSITLNKSEQKSLEPFVKDQMKINTQYLKLIVGHPTEQIYQKVLSLYPY